MLQQLALLDAQLAALRFHCPMEQADAGEASDREAAAALRGALGEQLSGLEADAASAAAKLADALSAAAGYSCEQGLRGTHAAVSARLARRLPDLAPLLLAHAAAPQRGWLLRSLLRAALECSSEAPPKASQEERCRELLAGAVLYEVPTLDGEWPQAAASILHELLAAGLSPVVRSGPLESAAAAAEPEAREALAGSEAYGSLAHVWEGTAAVLRWHGRDGSAAATWGNAGATAGPQAVRDDSSSCSLGPLLGMTLSALAASPAADRAPDRVTTGDAVHHITQLFGILAAVPAPYFAARPASAAALAQAALATEAVLASLLQLGSAAAPDQESGPHDCNAGQALRALCAAHELLARLAEAGCGALLEASPRTVDWMLAVSTAALRFVAAQQQHRQLLEEAAEVSCGSWAPKPASSTAQSAAAVRMLHASRGVAHRMAAHCIAAGSVGAVEGGAAEVSVCSSDVGQATSGQADTAQLQTLHDALDRVGALSQALANGSAGRRGPGLLPAAAAAHVFAIAMAAASMGQPRRRAAAAILAGRVVH